MTIYMSTFQCAVVSSKMTHCVFAIKKQSYKKFYNIYGALAYTMDRVNLCMQYVIVCLYSNQNFVDSVSP